MSEITKKQQPFEYDAINDQLHCLTCKDTSIVPPYWDETTQGTSETCPDCRTDRRKKHRREEDKLPFASGGIRSHKTPRFDLIPRAFLECLADRLELGLARKGDREILQRYRRSDAAAKRAILEDEGWWVEMRNHLQDHLIYLRDGDFSDETLWGHAGAVMWNAGMLVWREKELEKLRLQENAPDRG